MLATGVGVAARLLTEQRAAVEVPVWAGILLLTALQVGEIICGTVTHLVEDKGQSSSQPSALTCTLTPNLYLTRM